MPPKIHLGVNMNFAKFVYGFQRALEIVRDEFGLRHVEIVADPDFGPMFYETSPEEFRAYHRENAAIARELGISVDTMFFFHRDNAAVAHPNPLVREAAYRCGLSALESAACYGVRLVGSQLMAIHREDAENPERFEELSDCAHDIWKRWMDDAHRLGIERMIVEMMSTLREGCSTIDQTRRSLEIFDAHHRANPDSTAPTDLGYDIGHGIHEKESADPRDRDFRAWLESFPDRTPEIHLKDTDEDCVSTWHFGGNEGVVDLDTFVQSVRDVLTVPELWLFFEVPGKRGRLLTEDQNIEGHKTSVRLFRQALEAAGYRENEKEGTWYPS